MRGSVLIGAAGLLAVGAWVMYRQRQEEAAPDAAPADGGGWLESAADVGDTIVSKTVNLLQLWRAPERYAGLIAQAEQDNGLPALMLERLLYQESRYREDIISGATRSPAGALGIAQFMPATARDMGIDPLNPAQAIPAAARYLRSLFNRFGNWSEALAAYNWGMGNVSRKGLEAAPRETRNYFGQILADVNSTAGTDYA
ncbi:lytic transglycosylase domain-containing protein [Roseateles microcysteis]|uniref:lytic transglycosylase domain-containing protein n=1 Tax=Roseateles microcysteis TaxID=3119057 RepID=UPI002FE5358B